MFTRDEDLALWRRIGLFAGHSTATPGVIAHTAAWREGDAWLARVLEYLEGNRALLGQLLRERLPQLHWIAPQGTYLAWLDCSGLGLERSRVALTDGAECGTGGEGHVRLNFAMPRPLLREAIERMAEAVASL